MEGIAIKVPGVQKLYTLTGLLSPRIAIGQGGIKCKCNNAGSQECHDASPPDCGGIPDSNRTSNTIGCKIVDLAHCDNRKVKGREIMVKEELTLHQIKGEIVERPAKDRSSNLVIESLEIDILVVVIPTLPAKH